MSGGVTLENGKIIYSPSAFGSCLKSLVAARMGYYPQPSRGKINEVFSAGHRTEDLVVDILEKHYNIQVEGRQEPVELYIGESASGYPIFFLCHLDGLAFISSDQINHIWSVFDIKSMSESSALKFDKYGFEGDLFAWRYRWQFSIYHIATGLPFVLITRDRSLPDGSDPDIPLDPMLGFVYFDEFPENYFFTLDQIKERVYEVESYVEKDMLPERCEYRMYPCPFLFLHDDEYEYTPKTHDEEIPPTIPDLDDLYLQRIEAKQDLANAQNRLDAINDEIIGTLGETRKALTTFGKPVSYYYGWQTRYDWARMQQDGIDLSPYKVETINRRPTVVADRAKKGDREE